MRANIRAAATYVGANQVYMKKGFSFQLMKYMTERLTKKKKKGRYLSEFWLLVSQFFSMYLLHPDWPGCRLPPACLSYSPCSSHPPAMKGSPARTTSEPGWKCGSSLKEKIELLCKKKKKKIKRNSRGRRRDFNEITILIETMFLCRMEL